MLIPQDAELYSHEYDKLLHRIGGSQSDILELPYVHEVVLKLIQVDLNTIINHNNHDLNSTDSLGRTPLHWAVLQADEPAVSALLRARVDVEARDNDGKTALHFAITTENQRCLELLLIAKSDIHAKDHFGYQTLHWAMCTSSLQSGMLEILLLAGPDVHNRNNHGGTPLHLACMFDCLNGAEMLIAASARINEEDHDGDLPLIYGIYRQHPQIIQLLLKHDVQIEKRNKHGHTVLHVLALYGTLTTIAPFMSPEVRMEKVKREEKDRKGRTAWELLQDRPAPPEGYQGAFETLLARCRGKGRDDIDQEVVEVE